MTGEGARRQGRGQTVVVSTESAAVPEEALSVLDPGEAVLVWGWARIQKFGTPFGTFYPVGMVVRAVDLVRNRRHLAKIRKAASDLGFPVGRTMVVVVTSHRLLIWPAHRHPRRIGGFLGEVSRARIAAAKLPFSNSGPWKTLRLWLTDTTWIQFQVDARSSARLVSVLDSSGTN